MDRRNNNHQIIRMSTKQKKFTYINFLNITAAAWAAVMFLFLPSCGGKKQNLADAVSEGDSLPDMHTTGDHFNFRLRLDPLQDRNGRMADLQQTEPSFLGFRKRPLHGKV